MLRITERRLIAVADSRGQRIPGSLDILRSPPCTAQPHCDEGAERGKYTYLFELQRGDETVMMNDDDDDGMRQIADVWNASIPVPCTTAYLRANS